MSKPVIRPARKADSPHITALTDIAAEGMAVYLWQQIAAEGQSPMLVGLDRVNRDIGGFSYRNTLMLEAGGDAAAIMVSYPLTEEGPEQSDGPEPLRPLLDLEALVAGYWYINVLAVYPQYRRLGFGTTLLQHADRFAATVGALGTGLIVASGNEGALAMYRMHGYREMERRPAVDYPGGRKEQEWLLMTKPGS